MAKGLDYKVYYWREKNDEVDFVIEHNHQCVAIEVKIGKRTTNEGLSKFSRKFQPKHSFVIGAGDVPVEEFFLWDLHTLFE